MVVLTQEQLSSYWVEYKDNDCQRARERLIEHYYVSLVKPVANRMGSQLSSAVDRNDLASYGTFGLIDAIEKFDRSKGVKFETYAVSRIRGSILDELRTLDWVPRGIRSKVRNLDRVYGQLEGELNRTVSQAELATKMGLSTHELKAITVTSVTTFDSSPLDDETSTIGATVPDWSFDPEEVAEVTDITERVARAVHSLGERARVIIVLYYLEQMTLGEIGEALGVTESRVCQLHGNVLKALRDALAAA